MQLDLSGLQRLVPETTNQAGRFPSLAELLALSQQRLGPTATSREINPGTAWGGRDRNAVMPDDVMRSRFFAQPPEGL